MESKHIPNSRIKERKESGVSQIMHEYDGINGRIALFITNMVGTMWCAYIFAILAFISLPTAIKGGISTLIPWIAQTFLQLVLLSIIMVGQKIAAKASDKQALQTYKDAEAMLEIQDEMHRLIKINNSLTEEIHSIVKNSKSAK